MPNHTNTHTNRYSLTAQIYALTNTQQPRSFYLKEKTNSIHTDECSVFLVAWTDRLFCFETDKIKEQSTKCDILSLFLHFILYFDFSCFYFLSLWFVHRTIANIITFSCFSAALFWLINWCNHAPFTSSFTSFLFLFLFLK